MKKKSTRIKEANKYFKKMIKDLTLILDLNETELANFLGVTRDTLNQWKDFKTTPPKIIRLINLDLLVSKLLQADSFPTSEYKSFIENSRTVYNGKTVSLLNCIIENLLWLPDLESLIIEHELIQGLYEVLEYKRKKSKRKS